MTIYYLVPVPSSQTSVSGGTRKLFDHVAILRQHGIAAEILHHLPPARIESGPENLFIFPEVYGEHLVDALPPGVPRISMVQNGYLLDYDQMAPPKDPHPFLRCPDLVAVMVESQHTEDIVRARFPDLPCPIIRFTSSGNGRDGKKTGLHFGAWPRERVVTYFEYKRRELNTVVFDGLDLPAGWSLRPMANMTDDQVAETLRSSAIFAAPLTHEGLCATTQEAMIAGAVIVAWPGGPSEHVPTGWPASTPRIATVGNTTVGGPMEYLAGRAEIAPQDDIAALRALIESTARSIEDDWHPWAKRSEDASRWHTQQDYSREHEIAELLDIVRDLDATRPAPGFLVRATPPREVLAFDPAERAAAFVALGRDAEAVEVLLDAMAVGVAVEQLDRLLACLGRLGRPLASVIDALDPLSHPAFLPKLLVAPPSAADQVLELLFQRDPGSLRVLATAAGVALGLAVDRQIVWSSRLRSRNLAHSCPAIATATDMSRPALERAVAAAAAWATFKDRRAEFAFVASALALGDERVEVARALAAIAPDLAAAIGSLGANSRPTGRTSWDAGRDAIVVAPSAGSLRASTIAARLAAAGRTVLLVEPGPTPDASSVLGALGVEVDGWSDGSDWATSCLATLVRHHRDLEDPLVVLPNTDADRLVPMVRRLFERAWIVVDVQDGPIPPVAADQYVSDNERDGASLVSLGDPAHLPIRPATPYSARHGVCVLADLRDRKPPSLATFDRVLEEVGDVLGSTPVAVIGDDPDHQLDSTGWMAVGALTDPTSWIAASKVAVVVDGDPDRWRALAQRGGTPLLVVPSERDAASALADPLRAILADEAAFSASLRSASSAGTATHSAPEPNPFAVPTGSDGVASPAATVHLLVDANELLDDAALLTSFGGAFTAADDVALVVYGPGLDATAFEPSLRALATRCGFDLESGPRVLCLLPPVTSEEEEAAIADQVAAVLGSGLAAPAFSGLARVDTVTPEALVALLGAREGSAGLRERRAALRLVKRTPLVSVLIPVYNHAPYLEGCIESVLAQSCDDLEIILVEDRSTDGAAAVLDSFADRDERITIVHNDRNLGLVGNHRRCLSLATGEFVKFLHADDRLRPNAIERLVAGALAHPEATLVTSARGVIDLDGRPQPPTPWTLPFATEDTVFDGKVIGSYLLSSGLNKVGEPSTVLFRRSSLAPEEFSSYAGRTYTSLLDISTWIRLLAKGSLLFLGETLSDVRLHPGQYGNELGMVIQYLEYLRLIEDSTEEGFLVGGDLLTVALGTMGLRLMNAYCMAPGTSATEVAEALATTVTRMAPSNARRGARAA